MKRNRLLVLIGVLIVLGGLFFIFTQNQTQDLTGDQKHSEANASPKYGNETARSTIKDDSSSGQSEANSSSVSAQSDDSEVSRPSSEQSSTSDQSTAISSSGTSGETGKAASQSQAINRPDGAWVDHFEENLYKGYHATPSRYQYIGDGLWEVWVKEYDTGQQPYVTVNQDTGDFHG